MLIHCVQSLVKSMADILCSSTAKSNEKLFYSHTYLLTVYKKKIFREADRIRKSTETIVKNYIYSTRI